MVFIFNMSSANATESTNISGRFIEKIADIFVKSFKDLDEAARLQFIQSLQHFVRKTAHFLLFSGLGISAAGFVYTFNFSILFRIVSSSAFCLLYAVFDEVHQLFIPGRSGQISDVLLDFSGAVCGILLISIVICLFIKIRSKINETRARQ